MDITWIMTWKESLNDFIFIIFCKFCLLSLHNSTIESAIHLQADVTIKIGTVVLWRIDLDFDVRKNIVMENSHCIRFCSADGRFASYVQVRDRKQSQIIQLKA